MHGSRKGNIPRDFHGKTVGTVIKTKLITVIAMGMRTASKVIPWDSNDFSHFRAEE